MKSNYENGIYSVEPETSDEESELKSLIARFSVRGFSAADSFQATRSRPSAPVHSTVGAGL